MENETNSLLHRATKKAFLLTLVCVMVVSCLIGCGTKKKEDAKPVPSQTQQEQNTNKQGSKPVTGKQQTGQKPAGGKQQTGQKPADGKQQTGQKPADGKQQTNQKPGQKTENNTNSSSNTQGSKTPAKK